jgi:flagellar hook-associated protein 1 FlgK
MSDMLAIAKSGVRAYARALEVVADNVANAATPGHVRRTSTLSPAIVEGGQPPLELDPVGGNGVRLTAINRAIDGLRADTVRRAEGQVNGLDSMDRWLTSVQSALSGANRLETPLNELFASLSDLANDPSSPAVRQIFLSKAETLADRFNRTASELKGVDSNLLTEADTEVRQLNGLAQGLAAVNAQLRRATSGSSAAVVLADERDRILAKLSTIVTFEVRFDARGQASVRIPDAGGPLLVDGQTARSARIVPSGAGLTLRIGPKGADEAAALTGGTLAGLSTARIHVTQARTQLDALADRITSDFNRLHRQGVDFEGNGGGDLFSTTRPVVAPARANGGTARIDATLTDGATPPPLNLSFDGTQWTLARDDGTASVSGAFPLLLDGVTVDLAGGTPANGDLYRVTVGAGAAGIGLRPLGQAQVAAAPRWQADAAPSNRGSGVADVRISAPAALPATPPFIVTTLADGSLSLADSLGSVLASGAPGDWLEGDGFAVRIDRLPLEGDLFTIARTGAGDGANGNALALLGLRETGGAAGTLGDALDSLITRVSVPLAETRARLDVARANRDTAAEALTQASGVDLNTEATEMLRLQQAFSANSRVIQAAREIFEAILNAAR